MALDKNTLNIPLALGLQQKTDPWQLAPGQFLVLKNWVFTTDKRLTTRNGYPTLSVLPEGNAVNTLATFQGSLVGLGTDLFSFNGDQWIDKGRMQPIEVSTLSAARSSFNQTSPDAAYADNGLVCVVWEETDGSGTIGKYQVIDKASGELVYGPTALPNEARCPRVYLLGNFFVVTFLANVASTPHLQYISIPVANVLAPNPAVDISTQVSDEVDGAYDGFLSGSGISSRLYIAWNGSDLGGAIHFKYLDHLVQQHVEFSEAGETADLLSIYVDDATYVWVTWFDDSATETKAACYGPELSNTLVAPTVLDASLEVAALSTLSSNGTLSAYLQVEDVYTGGSVRSDYITSITCTQTPVVGSPVTVALGVGLAGEAFFNEDLTYMLVAYGSPSDPQSGYEPSYFLITSSGDVVSRLAYSNGGGYASEDSQVLSNVTLIDGVANQGYLRKDLLQSMNNGLDNDPAAAQAGVYSQTGVNLVSFDFTPEELITDEIAGNLNASGGMLWQYDGTRPVENNFHVFPEDITAAQTTGGDMADQQYFYQVCYEYTDSQGNLSRSAPSIPVGVNVTSGSGNAAVELVIPTLRLTYKTNVRIVIYRWSQAQQNYYQVTSISDPIVNDPTVNDITYTDEFADEDIIGNNLIYTTGGVIENIASPPVATLTLFKARQWVLDAENRNLLWYSKTVVEQTPVEMSDLFTNYVPPSTSSQGYTGHITSISSMDDKLIIFKANSIFYISGNGPDNTGANNDFSEAIFVTSAVGCTNQRSIVLTPNGLMFESNQGIWLLDRSLQVSYIGSPVEGFNGDHVVAAVSVPATTQVRFSLESGVKLMYDYFYGKWGTFNGAKSISATVFEGTETLLTPYSQVWKETPGSYVDGSSPVLPGLTTGWLNLAGLQGFQRAYFMYLIGDYKSPHTLNIEVAYDYNPSKKDSYSISPDNFSPAWGGDYSWGQGSPWGGNGTLEQWRLFFKQQKCQAIQISLNVIYDPSFDVNPGASLSLSGINLVLGAKSTYPRLRATRQVG